MRNSPIAVLLLLAGTLAAALFAYNLTGRYVARANAVHVLTVADASGSAHVLDDAEDASAVPATRTNPSQVISAVEVANADIYLLNSESAHKYALPAGQNYDDVLTQWRNYFEDRDLRYNEIHDGDLNTALRPGILILPSAVTLSPAQRAAIAAFEKNGGSVLATWATGTKDASGHPTGYSFLRSQFDIRVSGEMGPHDEQEFLVAAGDTPVASTLPSGSRMWLGLDQAHQRPLRVTGGANVAARFMDWDRIADSTVANEGVVYAEVGPSRRAYFAFPEAIWQFDQDNLYLLVDDVMNWLRRHPQAYLANWPYPYRAAQIIEMDTEQGFPNAANLADMFDANGFHGTFYCVSSIAKLYPDVIKRLEQQNEIAYHGDVHDAFKGQPKATQARRLDTMRQEMTPLVSDPAALRGFRPPYELADKVVEGLLSQKGFGHILATGDTDTMLPAISTESPDDFQKGLLVIPRTQPDDMNFKDEGYSEKRMAREMKEGFDLARELGGLGVLSVHTQNFDPDSPVAKAMLEFFVHIKAHGSQTWIAPSGTIERWWRNRSLLKAQFVGDARKMRVEVTVAKPGLHWAAALVVSNPVKGVAPTVSPVGTGMPLVQVQRVDDYQTAIVFDAPAPGTYRYDLTFQQPATSAPPAGAARRSATALALAAR